MAPFLRNAIAQIGLHTFLNCCHEPNTIGYDCLITPGVKIGNGAIISSRSVVVTDVPPYTVVGGNPAKAMKEFFSQEIVLALEEIGWWDWPIEKISKHLAVIVSADVEALRGCSDV